MTSATAIIPARYDSTRFPGKVLANRTGKPLIQHVYERARNAQSIETVLVATDDKRIRTAVEHFGGRVIMTRSDHTNGTSRLAEAACHIDSEIIVNVQGDEPEIEPSLIDQTVHALENDRECPMATLGSPLDPNDDPENSNIVKVIVDSAMRAEDFRRSVTPHMENVYKHVGLYVYRRDFLINYSKLTPTKREQSERLEQLRVLEHGFPIAVTIGDTHSHGIDTPEQYAEFVTRYASTL